MTEPETTLAIFKQVKDLGEPAELWAEYYPIPSPKALAEKVLKNRLKHDSQYHWFIEEIPWVPTAERIKGEN
jgi:hypothetical protein